jgi:4-hydroxybenzoate polyprenyltransferase
VPMLTAFKLTDRAALVGASVTFVAFCFTASAGYLVNDLLDLQADRLHPRKRLRPLAAGEISIPAALGAAVLMLIAALWLVIPRGWPLTTWLLVYLAMTLSYSLYIKRVALLDIGLLAALYTVRVLAGGAAVEVEVSFWLLAFSAFLFFSLALVKRCNELLSMRDRDEQTISGRAYAVGDLMALQGLGISTSVAAVLLFALFVRTPEVALRYSSPQWLWLTLTAMLLWLGQLWLHTARGEMHDDPLVFAMRRRDSLALVLAMLIGFALAALVR